jgi:hypothetical protein
MKCQIYIQTQFLQDKKNKKLHSTSSNYGESEKGLIQYIKNASYDSFKRRGSHEVVR